MADIVDSATRSRMMAAIRGKDTRPEMIIRRGLHALGFRYRLHAPHLPGKPDMVFPSLGAIIFVHGCFWHGHDCPLFRWPATRVEFWRKKISATRERDEQVSEALHGTGWRVFHIWECSLKGAGRLGVDTVILTTANWLRSEKSMGTIKGEFVSDGPG